MKKVTAVVLILCLLISSMALAVAEEKSATYLKDLDWSTEPITLTILNQTSPEGTDAGSVFVTTRIEEWKAAHPNVTIIYNYSPQTELKTKQQAAAADGQLPSLVHTIGYYMNNYVDNGLVMDLTDYIADYEYSDKIADGLLTPYTINGRVYALPTELAITSIIFYNKTLWAQAGYEEFPDNWDDIFKAWDYFKANGIDAFAVGNLDQWTTESLWMGQLFDRFCGTEWKWDLINLNGKAKWTDKESIDALAFFQKFGTSGYFNKDWAAIYADDAWGYYVRGKAATCVQGYWNINGWGDLSIMTDDVRDNTGIALWPAVEGGKGAANVVAGGSGWAYAISDKQTDLEKAACLDLLFYIQGYEYSENWVKATGTPCLFTVALEDLSPYYPPVVEFIQKSQDWAYSPILDVNYDAKLVDVFMIKLADLWAGKTTPEEVAEALQKVQETLEANAE